MVYSGVDNHQNSSFKKANVNGRCNYFEDAAAVSCSSVPYRLGAGGIHVLVDGQAGPCMASMHGWCMGAWQHGGLIVCNFLWGVCCYWGVLEMTTLYCCYYLTRVT